MPSEAVVSMTSGPSRDLAGEQLLFTSNSTSEPAVAYWTVPWRVALTLSLALIMCAAVLGNSLVVVVVLRNRGMRTRTNLFLCNLAVADLLCAVVDMPFSLITVASGRWVFNDVVCKVGSCTTVYLFYSRPYCASCPSDCPSVPPVWLLTAKQESVENKLNYGNVFRPRATVIGAPFSLFIRSKVKVAGRQKARDNGAHVA